MKRSKTLIGLMATALVLPLGAMTATATATEIAPADATAWTEWVSDDPGSAGREQPAISANGRFVVMVGRSSDSGGVWIKDRLRPLTPAVRVAEGFLFNPDISADGSTVAWAEYGSGSGGGQQVYTLKWRVPGAQPVIASLGDDDLPADKVTDFPSLSRDGRYVAFQSMDLTLDAQATGAQGGNRTKAYVRDMLLGTTEMVSVTDDEKVPNGSGIKPDITPDGRYVAFASDSTDLQGIASEDEEAEEEETVTFQQIYRRDRVGKTTVPVSINAVGDFGDGSSSASTGPSISDNGLRIAFESMATNLVTGDTNADTDVFVRKLGIAVTERVSLNSAGAQVDTDDTDDVAAGTVEDDPTTNEDESKAVDALPVGTNPAISGDAGYVAFMSTAALMTEDENGVADIYRFGMADAKAPGLTRWSVVDDPDDVMAFEASGTRIDGESGEEVVASNGADPTITYDGLRLAFVSQGNLTGRVVEEEEGEEPTDEPTVTAVTAIEPSIYLHRANPEPDTILPTSRAFSPVRVTVPLIKVTYVSRDPLYPSSGVTNVRLYMRKPGQTRFWWIATEGAAGDGLFKVRVVREGRYSFFTRAKDAQGNLEFMPVPAVRDTVTLFRR